MAATFDLPTRSSVGVYLTLHGAVVDMKIITIRGVKCAVTAAIKIGNTVVARFQTPVDENGGKTPTWNYSRDLVVPFPDTKNCHLVLELKHYGTLQTFIGQAVVSLELLEAGGKIGKAIQHPLMNSGKLVGHIIASHEIRVVRDIVEGTNPTPGGQAAADSDSGPAVADGGGEHRGHFKSLFTCFTATGVSVGAGELRELIFGG